MKCLPIISWFLLMALFQQLVAQPNYDERAYLAQAAALQQAGNWQASVTPLQAAYRVSRKHPQIGWRLATAQLRAGHTKVAVKLLQQLLAQQFVPPLASDTLWQRALPPATYQRLTAQLMELSRPLTTSTVLYRGTDSNYIPESFAYDARSKRLIWGSLLANGVVQAPLTGGPVTRFLTDKLQAEALGIKLDTAAGLVALCEGAAQDSVGRLRMINLTTGQTVRLVQLTGGPHLLNDLAFLPTGALYFTDSEQNAVYQLPTLQSKPEVLPLGLPLLYPNGITAASATRLYIADVRGICSVQLKPHITARALTASRKVALNSIDGLYYYHNSLIGIRAWQPGKGQGEVVRFFLNANGNRVVRQQVLERNRPDYNTPTTGLIMDNELWYIANAQLELAEHPDPRVPIQPPLLLRLHLE